MAMALIPAALALAALGMGFAGQEEDAIEQDIRDSMADQGTVGQVEMVRQADGTFTGFAVLSDERGREERFDCTALPTGDGDYDWRCLPTLGESTIEEVEASIRETLAQQATVLEVALTRVDDGRMTGFARLRDEAGKETRARCSATRENEMSSLFDWECTPEE